MRLLIAAVMVSSVALSGCVAATSPKEEEVSLPAMRWDHRPEAAHWTDRSLNVVAAEDDQLAEQVPADIEAWCPGYTTASIDERRAFWVGLLSATAKHESTWNPSAAGGGGRWIGLMQISPATARHYNCEAQSTAALKDGAANLACAIRIMSEQVDKDGLVAGGGNRGIGRDWAPFRNASKRADIAEWTRSQSYCRA
ncbi:MAG: lytic transglycosylase domain-containing protein [Cypionkella sp.]|nr:lytic transglycosylase domain-containing protein [Cypionkella sp.]